MNDLAMLVIFHNKIVYWMFPLPLLSIVWTVWVKCECWNCQLLFIWIEITGSVDFILEVGVTSHAQIRHIVLGCLASISLFIMFNLCACNVCENRRTIKKF